MLWFSLGLSLQDLKILVIFDMKEVYVHLWSYTVQLAMEVNKLSNQLSSQLTEKMERKKKAKVLTSGVFQLEKHARLCLPFLHHYFPATAVWEVCLTIRLKSGIISIKEEKGKGR